MEILAKYTWPTDVFPAHAGMIRPSPKPQPQFQACSPLTRG